MLEIIMPRIFTIIVVVFSCSVLAGPPKIACLSGMTVKEAFESQKHFGDKNILFVVSNGSYDSQTWSDSIWNDAEFVEHLKKSGITAVYLDRESDPVLHELLHISSVPTFVLYHDGIFLTRRHGMARAAPETRSLYKKWIDAARMGTTIARGIVRELGKDSENIQLRFELMKEFQREGDDVSYFEQLAWFLDHNELCYQFLISLEEYSSEEYSDPEMYYRAAILWFTGGPRGNFGLTKGTKPMYEGGPIRDGWAEAIQMVDADRVNSIGDRKIEVFVNLRRTLEDRRDREIATDRDLFILKALTAERDEGRAMAEKYQPYFK